MCCRYVLSLEGEKALLKEEWQLTYPLIQERNSSCRLQCQTYSNNKDYSKCSERRKQT